MNAEALAILDQLEKATAAAIALTRTLVAGREDGDEWTRLPAPGTRCPISGWSRSKLYHLTTAGKVRRKSVGGTSYYSGADVRRIITG